MSQYTSTATIVGASYFEAYENFDEDSNTSFDDLVTKLGLEIWSQMPRFDTLTDVYVGVVFYERPTDAEVEEAKAEVAAALPALKEAFGEPESDIEIWNGVHIG